MRFWYGFCMSQLIKNRKLRLFFLASSTVFALGLLIASFSIFSSLNIASAATNTWLPPAGKSILEIHVANNGMTYLRGAKVISVQGSTLNVETAWNSVAFDWIIQTNGVTYDTRHFGTRILDASGNELDISRVQVGDVVLISGQLDVNSKIPTINADVVRIAN